MAYNTSVHDTKRLFAIFVNLWPRSLVTDGPGLPPGKLGLCTFVKVWGGEGNESGLLAP